MKAEAIMPQPRAEATKRLCHDEWAASSNFAVNWDMAAAAGRGHETIVRLCHDEGAQPIYIQLWPKPRVGCSLFG